jgi:phage shock protein PspC (stress-responsive transcriptional regulator)
MNTTSTLWDESVGLLRRWKDALTRLSARHGFYRSRRHRLIAGVCGGLAERFDVPVSLVRLVFVLVALPGFVHAALFYVALAYLMPQSDELDAYSS